MKIKVYNDSIKTFEGSAREFLEINEFDEETKQQLKETYKNNYCKTNMFSGCWEIYRIK